MTSPLRMKTRGIRGRRIELPLSLERAFAALALSEGRSFNAQVVLVLAREVGHEPYEKTESWEAATDRPTKQELELAAAENRG